MTTDNHPDAAGRVYRLLEVERDSFVRLLHDDLGQCLVAIRSMACALAEQEAGGETAEIAELIRQAADSAYHSAYDRMQELRAREIAETDLHAAMQNCASEARLAENGFEFRLSVDAFETAPAAFLRAMLLRDLRCLLNVSRRLARGGDIDASLAVIDGGRVLRLRFRLLADTAGDPSIVETRLADMQNRVRAAGGSMCYTIGQACPLEVELTMPFEGPAGCVND